MSDRQTPPSHLSRVDVGQLLERRSAPNVGKVAGGQRSSGGAGPSFDSLLEDLRATVTAARAGGASIQDEKQNLETAARVLKTANSIAIALVRLKTLAANFTYGIEMNEHGQEVPTAQLDKHALMKRDASVRNFKSVVDTFQDSVNTVLRRAVPLIKARRSVDTSESALQALEESYSSLVNTIKDIVTTVRTWTFEKSEPDDTPSESDSTTTDESPEPRSSFAASQRANRINILEMCAKAVIDARSLVEYVIAVSTSTPSGISREQLDTFSTKAREYVTTLHELIQWAREKQYYTEETTLRNATHDLVTAAKARIETLQRQCSSSSFGAINKSASTMHNAPNANADNFESADDEDEDDVGPIDIGVSTLPDRTTPASLIDNTDDPSSSLSISSPRRPSSTSRDPTGALNAAIHAVADAISLLMHKEKSRAELKKQRRRGSVRPRGSDRGLLSWTPEQVASELASAEAAAAAAAPAAVPKRRPVAPPAAAAAAEPATRGERKSALFRRLEKHVNVDAASDDGEATANVDILETAAVAAETGTRGRAPTLSEKAAAAVSSLTGAAPVVSTMATPSKPTSGGGSGKQRRLAPAEAEAVRAQNRERARAAALREFLTSESTYCAQLRTVCGLLIEPLRRERGSQSAASTVGSPPAGSAAAANHVPHLLTSLFDAWVAIATHTRTMLDEFRARISASANASGSANAAKPLAVGDVLVKLVPALASYVHYVSTVDVAMEKLRLAMQVPGSLLCRHVDSFMRTVTTGASYAAVRLPGNDIRHYFALPIHRLQKYEQLLTAIAAYEDSVDLGVAVGRVREVNDWVRLRRREEDNRRKFLELSHMIVFSRKHEPVRQWLFAVGDVAPAELLGGVCAFGAASRVRWFLRDGPLYLVNTAKGRMAKRPHQCFLFSDVLIITKSENDAAASGAGTARKFRFEAFVPLDRTKLNAARDFLWLLDVTFQLIVSGDAGPGGQVQEKTLTLGCLSEQEKAEWVKEIGDAIEMLKKETSASTTAMGLERSATSMSSSRRGVELAASLQQHGKG